MVNYEEAKLQLAKLSVEENKAQVQWFRHLTLVFATLLGVLASLHTTTHENQLSHLCYGLATLLLSLSLLSCFALLYIYSTWSAQQAKEAYRNELYNATKQGRDIQPCGVVLPKWCSILQKACYTTAAIAIVLLGIYSLIT